MDQLAAFDSLKSQIRPNLKEYLIAEGVEISDNGMFQCLNPMHSDSNASMKILSDLNNEQLFCYGCHAKGDIFTAHGWLHGAPLFGLEFIRDNVYVLAKKFCVPYEEVEFTPEQLECMEALRFVRLVSELMVAKDDRGKPINWTSEHAVDRGWKAEVCEKLRVSTIKDYSRFVRDIQCNSGISTSDVMERVPNYMFGPEYITITLYDEKGQPIGFTSRWLNWNKRSKQPKYRNSPHSIIFEKSRVLYGLHLVRSVSGRRLDIYEGNGSFITGFGAGHNSCVALCGSTLSNDHVELIRKVGFSSVNLVFDCDETGKEKAAKYMESLSGREGLKVSLTELPYGDPDEFIQNEGLEAYYKLGTISAFEWFINKYKPDVESGILDPVEFVKSMIKIIQNTDNRIERGIQIKTLAKVAGVEEADVRDELERLTRLSVDGIKKSLSRTIAGARDADDLLFALQSTERTINETSGGRQDRVKLSVEECSESFRDLAVTLRNRKQGIQGWVTDYLPLDVRLSGLPKPVGLDDIGNFIPVPGSLIGLAGAPQHGKSTILQNIALRVAELNQDATVLFWALDDSRERTFERMIAMHSGVDWKGITRRSSLGSLEKERMERSWNKISELISAGRLVIKDHSIGSSLPMAVRWVESMQEQFKRPVLLVIDSFHKIHASGDEVNLTEHSRTKKHSAIIKQLAQTHCISIMCSLELNKQASRGMEPDMLAITEARNIEYDFDVVGTVFNQYYDTDGDASAPILRDPNGNIMPVIKLNIRKSKEGGTGPVWFAMNQNNFNLTCHTTEEIQRLTNTEEVGETEILGGSIVPPDKGTLKYREPWAAK